MTDGCPGTDGSLACNRPFGSYRPSEPFRDFPFLPTGDDIQGIVRQLRLEEVLVRRPLARAASDLAPAYAREGT